MTMEHYLPIRYHYDQSFSTESREFNKLSNYALFQTIYCNNGVASSSLRLLSDWIFLKADAQQASKYTG